MCLRAWVRVLCGRFGSRCDSFSARFVHALSVYVCVYVRYTCACKVRVRRRKVLQFCTKEGSGGEMA